MLLARFAFSGVKRCPSISSCEVIVSRCSSSKRRNTDPSFAKLSDAIEERMKGVDAESAAQAADKLRTDMNTMAAIGKEMQQTSAKSEADVDQGPQNVTHEWLTIYRFRHIVALRILCRFKIYQTAFTAVVAISTLVSHSMGFAATTSLAYAMSFSAFAAVSLFVITNILRRVIGLAYLSADRNWVRISHIDFWGKRQDRIVEARHIVPLRDYPSGLTVRHVHLSQQQKSTSKYYVLLLKYALFPDPQTFAEVFGIDVSEIPVSKTDAPIADEKTDGQRVKDESKQ